MLVLNNMYLNRLTRPSADFFQLGEGDIRFKLPKTRTIHYFSQKTYYFCPLLWMRPCLFEFQAAFKK